MLESSAPEDQHRFMHLVEMTGLDKVDNLAKHCCSALSDYFETLLSIQAPSEPFLEEAHRVVSELIDDGEREPDPIVQYRLALGTRDALSHHIEPLLARYQVVLTTVVDTRRMLDARAKAAWEMVDLNDPQWQATLKEAYQDSVTQARYVCEDLESLTTSRLAELDVDTGMARLLAYIDNLRQRLEGMGRPTADIWPIRIRHTLPESGGSELLCDKTALPPAL